MNREDKVFQEKPEICFMASCPLCALRVATEESKLYGDERKIVRHKNPQGKWCRGVGHLVPTTY